MATKLDFPAFPVEGDIFTQNDLTWVYNGAAWATTTPIPELPASTLVGRGSSGTGAAQDITLGTGLTMSGATISASGSPPSNTVYGAGWNGDTTNAASKNAIYDKIELLDAAIGASGGGGTVQGSFVTYDVLLASADGVAPVGTADKSVDLQAVRAASTQTSKGISSVIGGGGNNTTEEAFAVVAGGSNNDNKSFAATISGGEGNQITGTFTQSAYSVIAGGRYNFIKSTSPSSTVSGEYNEIDSGGKSSILGGKNNRVTNSLYTTVSGGYGNLINTAVSGSRNVIAGGQTNQIQGSYGFIGSGQSNLITSYSSHAVIAGGNNNGTGSGFYGMTRCFIGSGQNNTMSGYNCFIGAGSGNDIDGFFGGSSSTSIIGGSTNSAYYASNSVVLGGRDCSLYYSNYTVMAGRRAKITVANKHGQFIYADDQDLDYVCNTERTANFRVANGMHISAPLFIDERASALADINGRGQIWVKNTIPNELWFTDDAGTDTQLGVAEVNDLTAAVTWANVPDANITQSSVTQHQAALSITESQISDLTHTTEVNDLSAAVTWANVPDANITQSSVTQHQAALSVTSSQVSDFDTEVSNNTDVTANTNARHSHGVYTVATLPATPAQGDSAFVTDSGNTLASHHGNIVANGGANFVPVHYNGTNWIVG